MMEEKDILQTRPELKKSPFTVPEGYFEEFKTGSRRPEADSKIYPVWKKVVSFASIAAALTAFVITGYIFLQKVTPADDFMLSDEQIADLVYNIPVTEDAEAYFYAANVETEDDEAVQYLILSGLEPEEILMDYEE